MKTPSKEKPKPKAPSFMTISELAKWLPAARWTLYRYLRKPNAPRPNQRKKYNAEEVQAFYLAETAKDEKKPRDENPAEASAPVMTEAAELRMATLRSRLARENHELAKARGELVPMAAVRAGAANFAREVHSLIRQYFELELPFLCKGRTAVEIQALAVERINRIEQRFAAHTTKLDGLLAKK